MKKLLRVIQKNWRMCFVVIILMTICGYVLASYGIKKHYVTTAEIFIESTDGTPASEKADTCLLLFTSPQMYNSINNTLSSGFSYAEYDRMISVTKKSGTQILKISTDCDNSDASYKLMIRYIELMPEVLDSYRAGAVFSIIRDPVQPSEPSFPNENTFTLLGALIGTFISIISVIIIWKLDNSITTDDDLKNLYDLSVLGEVPDFDEEIDYLGR